MGGRAVRGRLCISYAALEGNYTPPILAMLDWFYPRCARLGARGSVADAVALGSADRLPPAGADKR
jgi:hypothetical protein